MPRLRLQFRLRTLLIVTALVALGCGYVMWLRTIVSQRNRLRTWIKDNGGIVTEGYILKRPNRRLIQEASNDGQVSTIRQWLGDHRADQIILPAKLPDEAVVQETLELFPNSQVDRFAD